MTLSWTGRIPSGKRNHKTRYFPTKKFKRHVFIDRLVFFRSLFLGPNFQEEGADHSIRDQLAELCRFFTWICIWRMRTKICKFYVNIYLKEIFTHFRLPNERVSVILFGNNIWWVNQLIFNIFFNRNVCNFLRKKNVKKLVEMAREWGETLGIIEEHPPSKYYG